ncbi:MAG: hypothetical protein IJF88_00690 [Oscillospiraceae bacterium]|nr:hypothetical protein [Oscillospiraceae bacterium]MBQ9412304.1 hypothetical protein [Oscillospiraceae bacterium]
MDFLGEAVKKIEAQQPKTPDAVWGVGEQLKDILRGEPGLAEIVCQDLDNKALSLAECERKIKALADKKRKKGASVVCVTPMEAEEVIRAFYGLPKRGRTSPAALLGGTLPASGEGRTGGTVGSPAGEGKGVINLADFF